MSNLLDKLIAESSESLYPNADLDERFKAQKELEKRVVDEICRDEAARIDREARDKGKRRRFEEGMRELKMVLLQCFLLAFLVGLLVNHTYDAMKYLYEQDAMFSYVGIFALIIACVVVAFWMVASRVIDLYRMMQEGDEDE